MAFDGIRGLLGIAVLIALAWTVSERRTAFPVRTVLIGVASQLALAGLLLGVPAVRAALAALAALNGVITALSRATEAGTRFVFGYLGGGPPPFEVTDPGATFVLAFQALPIVLVMSALSAVLWHWRVLPVVIGGLAWAVRRGLGLSGAVSLASAANVFVGMVEAPLLIRPVIARLSRADLFLIMTVGLATVAGTVIVLYAGFLQGTVENPLGQILTASVISLPAAALIARVMVPADPAAAAAEDAVDADAAQPYAGTFDALVAGTEQGLRLLLNIAAMLVVLVALVDLVNILLGQIPSPGDPLTLQRLLGWAFAPLVWLIGIPWGEAVTAGQLMGIKTALNELIAFQQLAGTPNAELSERSRLIMTYAICGFANPGSLGIMIAGLTGLAPDRRAEILSLGPRAVLAGTLATLMTGAVASLLA
ncbi:nucleoside:proton symporter [Rhodovibrio sodomensis]|uniref:Nucleoside:proton symporter n=1 Tax=Rhodovibrio sodomensis TaxID=1088 RepID=A0ABS1DGQ2_9PROT|nr:nucleoside transporter C-terminal domain-containing protein [Rhodovibrio sodomensis]MBK1669171.1 nucleoside:proton symporter [Rhodovibrio sodomensis]